ncbi:hypothetical protein ACNYS0_42845 [Streptomyces sp. BH034]|uniref:hypothetical protein n=1 Tax=Streptomyces sp. BH034 TaxID=3402626 RepID=UPI003BB6C8A8
MAARWGGGADEEPSSRPRAAPGQGFAHPPERFLRARTRRPTPVATRSAASAARMPPRDSWPVSASCGPRGDGAAGAVGGAVTAGAEEEGAAGGVD